MQGTIVWTVACQQILLVVQTFSLGFRMPDPIDVHVGSRVRLRRTLLGYSQETLAQTLGLTVQQVQKYERGTNRIGAGRLFHLSTVLDCTPEFFFQDMPEEIEGFGIKGMAEEGTPFEADRSYSRRETLELVRAFFRIKNEALRDKLMALIEEIAATGAAGDPSADD